MLLPAMKKVEEHGFDVGVTTARCLSKKVAEAIGGVDWCRIDIQLYLIVMIFVVQRPNADC